MDTIVKGIVLNTKDYKDNDKLLNILTLEKGKILVKARGVKKSTSKLKAYCQSFCFAEFELVNSKGVYILTGVNEVESFYNLTTDIEKFNYAFCVLEIVDKICLENQDYSKIFVDMLKCLQEMNFGNTNVKLVLAKFIFNILNFEGFNLNIDKCLNCKTPLLNDLFISLTNGEILCRACKNYDSIQLDKSVFQVLKIMSRCNYVQLKTVKLSNIVLDKTLKFLIDNIYFRYEIKLKSIEL